MISPETIKQFQEVAESEFGFFLDETEALEVLSNLVGFFDLLAKINVREKESLNNQDIEGRQ